ncbi:aromatic ring-hydroxylating dioxygenase subunit alpha [Sphingomonas sp. SRS2]|uniref:aromatic ring-hydroxylating dioxygenase subunit alpha n=1 Tax=Sphingomonas sp. SRS2 TaxID=133190 RepID=UPI00061849F6|nr:aromatic ring-hydroxylating dioxygenase subunit alpha [Sphingomonas sp. SRS2]KKC25896.1 hypothetical protein WP12_11115 [Sphingomonas sp. SRS2]
MKFLKNVWYVAALPDQVGRELLGRKIAGVHVLLYRTQAGEAVAIADTCPHRFAPLNKGSLIGDNVECLYHGLQFSPAGRCVRNPQADLISPNMHIGRYPVVERHGLVWLWPGDERLADPAKIPDLSHIENSPTRRTVHSFIEAPYRHDILIDNLMDLTHIDFLHVGSFSGGPPESGETVVEERDNQVIVTRTQYRGAPPPRDADMGPLVDRRFHIRWFPSQVTAFEGRMVLPGGSLDQGRKTVFTHIATPADAKNTNYFMSFTREHAVEDRDLDAIISATQKKVIATEDGPMLEAIDRRMNGADLMELRPVVLPGDTGALRVRRVVKRLLQEEERHQAASEVRSA